MWHGLCYSNMRAKRETGVGQYRADERSSFWHDACILFLDYVAYGMGGGCPVKYLKYKSGLKRARVMSIIFQRAKESPQ